jgi:hypothetical protein
MAPSVFPDLSILPVDMATPIPRCARATPRPTGDALTVLRWGMAANWVGTATSPWVPPYGVAITFSEDANGAPGKYTATTIDRSGNFPFYYDRNPEMDTYQVTNIQANGSGSGSIYLEWLTSADELQNIVVDPSGTSLNFDYYHFSYGPVHYQLSCTD